MSKERTKELLELAIESLSHDMNVMRNSKIKRNRANEALAKITQIHIDLDLIYPSSFEKVDIVTSGAIVSDGSPSPSVNMTLGERFDELLFRTLAGDDTKS